MTTTMGAGGQPAERRCDGASVVPEVERGEGGWKKISGGHQMARRKKMENAEKAGHLK